MYDQSSSITPIPTATPLPSNLATSTPSTVIDDPLVVMGTDEVHTGLMAHLRHVVRELWPEGIRPPLTTTIAKVRRTAPAQTCQQEAKNLGLRDHQPDPEPDPSGSCRLSVR
jgi:hypothetical protein